MTLRDVIQRDMALINKGTTDNLELLQKVNLQLQQGNFDPALIQLKKHLDDSTLGASRKTFNTALNYIVELDRNGTVDHKPEPLPSWITVDKDSNSYENPEVVEALNLLEVRKDKLNG